MRWPKGSEWSRKIVVGGVCMMVPVTMRAQRSLAEAMRSASIAASSASAEETTGLPAPPASLEDALHSLYQAAGVVFSGEVIAVEHSGDAVIVRFRVEEGIRGVATGATYPLREWAGLWADDPSRYVVGERRLMLLHADSACGYASPAGGGAGSIRLRGNSVQGSVDLRWLAVQVQTSNTNGPQAQAQTRAIPLDDAATGTTASVADANAQVDSALVTSMLHAWQRAEVVQ